MTASAPFALNDGHVTALEDMVEDELAAAAAAPAPSPADRARGLYPRGGDWLIAAIAKHGLGEPERRAGRLFDWRLGVQRERAGIELARILLARDVDPLLVVGIVEAVSFRWDAPMLVENKLYAIVDSAAAREAKRRVTT